MDIFGSDKCLANSTFLLTDFKIPLVKSSRLSISVILLEFYYCPQKHLEYYPSLLFLNL